jgi:CubicO group peptidase (beta-lactamase class C family)
MQLSNAARHQRFWQIILLIAALSGTTTGAVAELAGSAVASNAPPCIPAISSSLQQFVDRGDLAGAVALVAQHGQLVHLDAVGYADVESQRPMRIDTMFSIMSMTKPVAAVAVLTHTSGLFSDQRNTGSLAETVARLAKQKLQFAPGARWQYSPGLTVAGRAVEVASGLPFDEFVATRICQPLKMSDTRFRLSEADKARLATTYAYNSREKTLLPTKINLLGPMETRSPNPSAGLYSTANDMFRFYQMLLQRGELDGVRILKPDTVDEMRRPQTGSLKAGFVPGSAWGLGVGLVQQPEGITSMLSPGTFGHGGMLGTQAWADPQREAVFILLIQRAGVPNSDASEYRLAFQQAAARALEAP